MSRVFNFKFFIKLLNGHQVVLIAIFLKWKNHFKHKQKKKPANGHQVVSIMKFIFFKEWKKSLWLWKKSFHKKKTPIVTTNLFIYLFCDEKIFFFVIKTTWWSQSGFFFNGNFFIFAIETIWWPPFLFLRMESSFYLQSRTLGHHKVVFIAK